MATKKAKATTKRTKPGPRRRSTAGRKRGERERAASAGADRLAANRAAPATVEAIVTTLSCADVMLRLKKAGSAQTRRIYARHGVQGEMFGVSAAALAKLEKQLKTNHALARELWASGNHDARVLATRIADPQALEERALDGMAGQCRDLLLAQSLAGLAARSRAAKSLMARWAASGDEWTSAAGWTIAARLAMEDREMPETAFEALLAWIERDIHRAPNGVRSAMNDTLIAIGIRSPSLEPKALATAARIGKVEVDHGETGCKTPDAAKSIRKTVDARGHRMG